VVHEGIARHAVRLALPQREKDGGCGKGKW
jgi:hypothetical protein